MKILQTLCIVAAVFTTLPTAFAQQPASPIPDGSPSKISDWALAGVIWSDASLTKKLADQAAEETDSAEQMARFKQLSQTSSEIVNAMEVFGWKQIKRSTAMSDSRPNAAPESEQTVSDPEVVGAATLDAPNRTAVDANGSRQVEGSARVNQTGDTPTLNPNIKRFDTETPLERNDPGMDDELTGDGIRLDLDTYRVDDYIDETPAEARNRADAIEDGVEGAIAAAAGLPGIGTGTAGRISRRESQTRSATLPYSRDSIYDADDYDPDVDYDVDNPLGVRSTNPDSVDLGDRDDDIDRGDPAKVVDGEDEFIAAMAREQASDRQPTGREQIGPARTDLDRYTPDRSKHVGDANWVQFHLDANQSVWSDFTTRENLTVQTRTALMKLKANMKAAIDATDSEQLRSILRRY